MSNNTVQLCSRRTLPVVSPKDRLRDLLDGRVTESDLRCLERLVDFGELEVRLDRDTRETLLAPSAAVKPFLRAVLVVN